MLRHQYLFPLCGRQESNLQGLLHSLLKAARLPNFATPACVFCADKQSLTHTGTSYLCRWEDSNLQERLSPYGPGPYASANSATPANYIAIISNAASYINLICISSETLVVNDTSCPGNVAFSPHIFAAFFPFANSSPKLRATSPRLSFLFTIIGL